MDDDDIWEDEGEYESTPAAERAMLEKNTMAENRDLFTTGFREGISQAKDDSRQTGFEEGFVKGSKAGILIGKLKGSIEAAKYSIERNLESDLIKNISMTQIKEAEKILNKPPQLSNSSLQKLENVYDSLQNQSESDLEWIQVVCETSGFGSEVRDLVMTMLSEQN